MKLTSLQISVGEHPDSQLDRAAALIDRAAAGGAELILMPELFAIPFVSSTLTHSYFSLAETLEGPSASLAARKAAEHQTSIVASFLERSQVPGVFYNTCCTYDNKGATVDVYRKSHLPMSAAFPEKFYFRPGDRPPRAVDVGPARVGTIICYERHYPELARSVALQGAVVLCIPVAAATPTMREIFEIELRAHAIANGFFVMCANRIGVEGDKTYFGGSAIYGPSGECLSRARDSGSGEVVEAEVDIDLVTTTRELRPFLRDRRPELYG